MPLLHRQAGRLPYLYGVGRVICPMRIGLGGECLFRIPLYKACPRGGGDTGKAYQVQ